MIRSFQRDSVNALAIPEFYEEERCLIEEADSLRARIAQDRRDQFVWIARNIESYSMENVEAQITGSVEPWAPEAILHLLHKRLHEYRENHGWRMPDGRLIF